MLRQASLILMLLATTTYADTVVSAQIIRPRTIITADDIRIQEASIAGGIDDPSEVIGKEARVAIYPGRPIRPGDIGAPALIDRNQIVTLLYERNGLLISTEGRSLTRAAAEESVRVMNLSSRTTVIGFLLPDGRVKVSQ
ncbi:flagella basal body P-ring formation protein FlgA [Salinihabitans flavidus]|uniref:Flagella basal body P-ring formation protein FlgA n=1 Tax=Salinihabitans flavidus TaxID=569882 RepID=A0A1H8LQK4_9RHOB|nr:flagellar basal body P-ring formation chaperone FlgA [Salinihabitans flavidus]SEO07364.1 flagella basal body P-ring formation protein FlgA [Salinihabitans flavidus]